jgi:hypothetical protein
MRFIFTYEPSVEINSNILNHLGSLCNVRQCEIEDIDMNSAIRQFRRKYGDSRIVNSFVHPEYHSQI